MAGIRVALYERVRVAVAVVCGLVVTSGTVRADAGLYFTESIGVGRGRGVRLALGDLQRHRHAPSVVRVEKIWLRFRKIRSAIALQPIQIDRAAMNVPHRHTPAELLRIRIRL